MSDVSPRYVPVTATTRGRRKLKAAAVSRQSSSLRALLAAVVATTMSFMHVEGRAFAQSKPGVLRVAMTVGDIPLTTGQPNQGAEGVRFIGITIYDGLTRFDMSKAEEAAKVVPSLAESWSVSAADPKIWTFKLRQGVKFHDGSEFDADAVVWNLEKLLKKDAPQFDQAQSNQGRSNSYTIGSWRKIDKWTVEITTNVVDAVLPYYLTKIFMSSPKRWEELGRDWGKVAAKPSGTGPWMLESFTPRERATLVRNPNYWDPKRVPKSNTLILLPMPDANARVAALLSGQVDWIEAPPPDAVPRLKQSKMQIVTNIYPHVWPYMLNFQDDSPFKDIRIRKAANLGIDRDGMVAMLGGLALPAKGMVDQHHPWFGKPTFEIKYDPDEARRLLKEAGYGPDKPVKAKIIISPAGSGQMQALPMNEFIKDNLKKVGIDLEFEVMDWEALRTRRRIVAEAPENKGRHGINSSWAYYDPNIGLIAASASFARVPAGFNWGGFNDPETDALARAAQVTFGAAQDEALAKLHTRLVDQAMWIWAVHDLNPRALGPKVKGYVQAQSWEQDLTPIVVE